MAESPLPSKKRELALKPKIDESNSIYFSSTAETPKVELRLKHERKPLPDLPNSGRSDMYPSPTHHTAIITANCFAELPEEMQRLVTAAKLDERCVDENFATLCNILHFRTRRCFANVQRPYDSTFHKTNYRLTPRLSQFIDVVRKEDVNSHYQVLQELGRGGYGSVFYAIEAKTSSKWAIKEIPFMKEKDKKHSIYEIAMLNFCSHPNIVKFHCAFAFHKKAWVVMEFLEGGSLSEAVKKHNFTEPEISYIALEILKAVNYLHKSQIAHRDLKSSNVMLSTTGEVKLSVCCLSSSLL
eukprot:TRINITY_DN1860_c0_g1_i1.p1 TRINITY_DN1860_c0_g1~~TRINITY_DN1860_c0_g1_i1.p1  ORF type:complete len:298 (-),score=46.13 TRINITY_DN1860_c0_g1_i1:566-1459(-)